MKTDSSSKPRKRGKTDEEYVEHVRRGLGYNRKTRYLSLVLGLGTLAIGIAIPLSLFQTLSIAMEDVDSIWSAVQPGLWLGWLMGAIGGIFILLGVIHLGIFMGQLMGNRKEKLLVKYYDNQPGK